MGKTFRRFEGEVISDNQLRKKWIDKSCRNHGGCPWCEGDRTHQYGKYPLIIEEEYDEVEEAEE